MGEKTNVHVGGYGSKKAGGVSGRKMAALVGAGMVVALLAVAGAWYLMADRVKEDLADALLRAEVAVAEQDYVRAKKILEAAIADVPSRADKAALTGAARKRLQEIAGNAAEQEQARAKAGAERKERDRQAIETKAKGEHERDAVAVLDKVKALLNGGDYEAAKDLALESVGRFADTSFGVEFPKLL